MNPIFEQILQRILQAIALMQFVMGNTAHAAQETTPFLIQDKVNGIQQDVDNVGFGLFAIKTAVDTLTTNLAADTASILAAIGTPQQTGSPVTLPTTPPSGYGSVDAVTIAAAVWAQVGATSGHEMGDLQEDAASFPSNFELWNNQVQFNQYAGWTPVWSSLWSEQITYGGVVPVLDWTTVLATDLTPVDWLNRVAGFTIVSDFGGGCPGATDTFGNVIYAPWLNTPTFLELRDKQLGLGKLRVAPVWPGLANVTLGTPVALATGVTITAAMDGVLIDITSAPAKQGFFTFDTAISYRNIGAIAFFSDDNQEEFPQLLGFTQAVYCPKTMEHAAGVVLRTSADVTGTITPFTLL
jgi:hypothetical protein